ncbi:MAG TPA: response regulator [Polyangiaceae bacterium]|nr:response regulator [Polyangiaceae bacterium]
MFVAATLGVMDVLLVDASATALRLVSGLDAEGFRVSWVKTRAAAEHFLSERYVSGVVLEAVLNGESTVDLAPKIRARFPKAVIVFATCYPSIASARAAIHWGADNYLVKPVGADELATLLSRERARRTWRPFTLASVRVEYLREITARYTSLAEAARVLGLDRRSLRRMLERYGLRKSLAPTPSRPCAEDLGASEPVAARLEYGP